MNKFAIIIPIVYTLAFILELWSNRDNSHLYSTSYAALLYSISAIYMLVIRSPKRLAKVRDIKIITVHMGYTSAKVLLTLIYIIVLMKLGMSSFTLIILKILVAYLVTLVVETTILSRK